MRGLLKQLERAKEMEKCGSCLYFKLKKRKLTRVQTWIRRYSMIEIGFGACRNETYLEDDPNGIVVKGDEPACSLYKPRR